jgi:hypothetical protein
VCVQLPGSFISVFNITIQLGQVFLDTSIKSSKRPRNSVCYPFMDSRKQCDMLDASLFFPKMKPQKTPHTPSRSSISYQVEHSKLSLPFRSPLFSRPIRSPNVVPQTNTVMAADTADNGGERGPTFPLCQSNAPITTPKLQEVSRLIAASPLSSRQRGGTSQNTKAASRPFKSPFKSPLSSLSSSTTKSLSSPNIQSMERRLQLLKRAVKIKAGEEEEKLEQLITKWRSVGREVSWEIWSVVRNQGQDNGWGVEAPEQRPGLGSHERSWGWDNTDGDKKEGGFESNWGYAIIDENGSGEDLVGSRSTRKTTNQPIRPGTNIGSTGDSHHVLNAQGC